MELDDSSHDSVKISGEATRVLMEHTDDVDEGDVVVATEYS